MKKNYLKIRMFAVLISLLSFRLAAQLSGIVTIDNTIPASGTNYTSFATFAASLNAVGVSGPLTVNVGASSTTFNEQVNFNAFAGSSTTNTVTINGNGRTITFNGTSGAPHTIMLSGADNIKVNNLNIIGTNATYAMVVHLWNQSDNNNFNTCTITCNANVTSSYAVPISLGGSSTNPQVSGNNNNNEFNACIANSGYWGVILYGNTGSPFNTNVRIINCKILDFYYQGLYLYYSTDILFKGNIMERTNRTTHTSTGYGIYTLGNLARVTIDGNHIRNMFSNGTTSNSFYAMQLNSSASASNEILVKNNIISDIRCYGQLWGIYNGGYTYQNYIHNTISFDDALATGGSTSTYGIMSYAGPSIIRNNIVTVTRGGTATKYCLYYSGVTTFTSNNNVLYMNSPSSTSYIGYWNANLATLTNWKTANAGTYDLQSTDVDPLYTALGSNYAPTAFAVNNFGTPLGVTTDIYNATRSTVAPDPGAIEIYNTPCSGAPSTVAISVPTATYCQGTPVNISFAVGNYTVAGLNFQWQSSTGSALGPFTAVSGATLGSMVTSTAVNVTTYYSVLVTCPGSGTTTIIGVPLNMAPITTSTVPYYESFESLNTQIKLPNCSWAISNATTALTQTVSNTNGRIPRTGSQFATFYNVPIGVSHFYTNGISLTAGVTYSASLWFLTESVGYTNWSDLSILVGPNQTPTGLVPIVSTNGPAVSPIHKLLSGLFTVPTTGIYYVAVRGTSGTGSAAYLSWDDLRIDLPCALNSPTVSLYTLNTTVCSNKPIDIVASGADSYTWSTGANSAMLTATPGLATTGYTVWATNALSGCTSAFVQNLNVLPSPVLFASSNVDFACSGSQVNLSALGLDVVAFSWDNGVNLPSTTVSPTVTTTYTVIGVNGYGCSSMATKLITVIPRPDVAAVASSTQICVGEPVSIMGSGATTYNWVSNTSIIYLGNPLVLNLAASAVFTVTGTDANGCSNKAFYTLSVDDCTGLSKTGSIAGGIKTYPNPTSGIFTIETTTKAIKHIEVIDVTGRVVLSRTSDDEKIHLNINTVADGLYYVKVKSENSSEIIKLIKK